MSTIFERSMCLQVSFGKLGTKRKVPTGAIEVTEQQGDESETDKTMLHVHKDILKSPELQAVISHDGETRKYLRALGVPARMLRGGIYLIPRPLVLTVDAKLQQFATEREALVEAFLAVYPTKVEEARTKLGSLFNSTDYPPAARVRTAFYMSMEYLPFGIPTELSDLSVEIYRRESRRAETRITEQTEQILQVLRLNMKQLVDHMVERLEPAAGGGRKVFHKTLVTNMTEFLTNFRARNLADDTQLDVLVEQAKGLLNGVEPDALKDNATLRTYVHHGMQQVKGLLDDMMTTRTRQINFEDEDEDADPAPVAVAA